MTAPTDVDRDAPVDTVWRLHTDVNAWPRWQTDVTAAHIDGTLEPGMSFDWTSYGFSVTSTVYELAERSRVLWGGTSGGITGVHEWLFSETTNGVHVTTIESFAGAPVEADAAGMQKLLDASLVAWLSHLKWPPSRRPDQALLRPGSALFSTLCRQRH